MSTIDISKLNKAEVLAALYNKSQPLGMGILYFTPEDITTEKAQKLLDQEIYYFDYLQGRVMKVDLSGEEFNTRGYDMNNGEGAAKRAIEHLF